MTPEYLKQFAEENPILDDPAQTSLTDFENAAKRAEQWERDWDEDDDFYDNERYT